MSRGFAFRALRFIVPAVAALSAAGCLSYAPVQLAGMSSLDLCELRVNQGVNLSAETKRVMQNELQRRNDDCSRHAAVIAERRAEAIYRDMYGQVDP